MWRRGYVFMALLARESLRLWHFGATRSVAWGGGERIWARYSAYDGENMRSRYTGTNVVMDRCGRSVAPMRLGDAFMAHWGDCDE
ncbi:hypothetical protein NDU88_005629 [Pleurodeles waltl]|uniref:Secreted protein n=1 Tax=Pleurodeles waltl TaxID=8319 RepID=A0AAV7L1U5_PLEWA|nr:hypothetical protein NDU88_005629 [Pleurodeles waltl]